MKSSIKHISLKKHKSYTENDKVFILNFTKSSPASKDINAIDMAANINTQ